MSEICYQMTTQVARNRSRSLSAITLVLFLGIFLLIVVFDIFSPDREARGRSSNQ